MVSLSIGEIYTGRTRFLLEAPGNLAEVSWGGIHVLRPTTASSLVTTGRAFRGALLIMFCMTGLFWRRLLSSISDGDRGGGWGAMLFSSFSISLRPVGRLLLTFCSGDDGGCGVGAAGTRELSAICIKSTGMLASEANQALATFVLMPSVESGGKVGTSMAVSGGICCLWGKQGICGITELLFESSLEPGNRGNGGGGIKPSGMFRGGIKGRSFRIEKPFKIGGNGQGICGSSDGGSGCCRAGGGRFKWLPLHLPSEFGRNCARKWSVGVVLSSTPS